MDLEAAMILLLCCGAVTLAAAVRGDSALGLRSTDLVLKAQAAVELKAVNEQKRSAEELQTLREQMAELKAVNAQTAAAVQRLQILTGQQEEAIQAARTSTYVRWGNSACGNASGLVYSGVMGGGWWNYTGSAVNYLCMTLAPVIGQRNLTGYFTSVYGTEYQTGDSDQDKDAVCAVCAVCRAAFSTTVMIPGTSTCSPDWSLQYKGYIMAGHHGDKSGTLHICVDEALESTPSNKTMNQNGALLHFTTAQCGSLLCGPYV